MESSSPEQIVYHALQYACSQNPELVKQAEEKLSEWEIEPGFYLTLLNIFSNQQVDVNVRWMAAVYFKNGVNKYWRKNAKNEIQQSEKDQIKRLLLANFNEPIPQVAVQIAALIAKIARFDCPREWPELVPLLLDTIRNTDQLQQHRALLVLQHVVKALSSRRMISDKKLFEQLTVNVYAFILNLWDGFTTLFFQSLQENNPQEITIAYLEKALLSLRIMRKLTIYGMHKPHNSQNCMLFLEAIFRRCKECLECRIELKRRNSTDTLIELTEKFILKQAKILNEFMEQHPLSFVNFISTALEFSFNYVFHTGAHMIYEGNVISFTHFAIRCINLMKGILSTTAYNSYVQEVISGGVNISIALTAKKEFFTKERLNYICEKIVTHYFLLTQNDLDQWMDDPENFAFDDCGESWKYALRPCMESFFLTLFTQLREDMTSEVVKYIRKAQAITLTSESSLKDILFKDAVYNAAGLSAFNLYDEVEFDDWFTNQLVNEIKIEADNFRIIRRRVIWLIGQWTGVKFSQSLRPDVYALCLRLLQPNEDMSVRLAASKTLMTTIDDFQFEPGPFLQYLEPCFSSLFILLKEAKECDTKMNVLCTMSFIVDKMSDNIRPQAEKLITYLPLLWKESADHNMLRCAIISNLLQIVKALCDVPAQLSPFIYPVIQISTDVKDPSHVYLMEEGLELWLAVIENSTTLNTELLDLCKNLLPIIVPHDACKIAWEHHIQTLLIEGDTLQQYQVSYENLRTVLHIIQAYIILSPQVYLQRYGKSVISSCTYMLSDMRPDGIVMVMKVFETCLRVDRNLGLELLKPVLPYIFKQVCDDKEYPMVMTMYLTIVARILLMDQNVFIEILQSLDQPKPLEKLLDIWLTKMLVVSQADKRKLMSLALASILTVDNNIFYERFPGIMQNICDTLNDVMKEDEDGAIYDSLYFADINQFDSSTMWTIEDFEYKTYHYERCRQLCMEDPLHRTILKDYLQSQVITLRDNLGYERFQSLMITVDPAILSNLTEYINIFVEIPKPTAVA